MKNTITLLALVLLSTAAQSTEVTSYSALLKTLADIEKSECSKSTSSDNSAFNPSHLALIGARISKIAVLGETEYRVKPGGRMVHSASYQIYVNSPNGYPMAQYNLESCKFDINCVKSYGICIN